MLERIANEGAGVLYNGSDIADNIISTVQATGGIMTKEDLAGYKVNVKEAGMIEYR